MSTLTDHLIDDEKLSEEAIEEQQEWANNTIEKIDLIKKSILGNIVNKFNNTEKIKDYDILLSQAERIFVKTVRGMKPTGVANYDKAIFYSLLYLSLRELKKHKCSVEVLHRTSVLYSIFIDDYQFTSGNKIFTSTISDTVIYAYLEYIYTMWYL